MHHETRTHTKEPAKTTGSTPSQYQSKGYIFKTVYASEERQRKLCFLSVGNGRKGDNRSQCASSTFWEQRK